MAKRYDYLEYYDDLKSAHHKLCHDLNLRGTNHSSFYVNDKVEQVFERTGLDGIHYLVVLVSREDDV